MCPIAAKRRRSRTCSADRSINAKYRYFAAIRRFQFLAVLTLVQCAPQMCARSGGGRLGGDGRPGNPRTHSRKQGLADRGDIRRFGFTVVLTALPSFATCLLVGRGGMLRSKDAPVTLRKSSQTA